MNRLVGVDLAERSLEILGAVRGDNPLAIMEECGHDDFKTTQGYIRTARALGKDFGEPFPELPMSLLEPEMERLARTDVAEIIGVSYSTVRRIEGMQLRPLSVPGGSTGSMQSRSPRLRKVSSDRVVPRSNRQPDRQQSVKAPRKQAILLQ